MEHFFDFGIFFAFGIMMVLQANRIPGFTKGVGWKYNLASLGIFTALYIVSAVSFAEALYCASLAL